MPQISSYFAWAKKYVLAHKVISAIVLVVVLWGGYWEYGRLTSTTGVTHYVLGTVATGTIIASLTESGQVSTTNTVSIQPQVSGQITWVSVQPGDKVRAGQALLQIDNTTALQSIAAAKQSLAASQLTYQQSQAQAPVTFQNDKIAFQNATTNLQDDYNSTFNDLTTTYLNLPNIMSTANDVIYGYDFDTKKSQWNMDVLVNLFVSGQMDTTKMKSFQTSSISDYHSAVTAYDTGLSTYQTTARGASNDVIDALLSQSVTMETAVAQALQSELNFLGAVSDLAQTFKVQLPTAFTTIQTNARTSLSSANSDLTTLLGDKKTIDAAKQAIVNAGQTVTLDQVGNPDGSNPITLQVASNSIQQAQQNLATLQTNLANYTIVAPFAGTVSAVTAQVGGNASGNLVTMISNSQIAAISVNEIDAAKIALGDKVTLTFDALPDLSLAGTIAQINSVGTVSQGVVSYSIQISFATQDPRVKPGMTVNAAIQTGIAQNTLVVPSSAVKTQGTQKYVLTFNPQIADSVVTAAGAQGVISATAPQQTPVVTGLSDNTNVQILSGLTSGQQIVVSTKTGSANTTSAASAATTRTGGGGFGGGGGGAVLRGL